MPGIDGAAAERLRRPTPRPPDQEDIAPSVQALLGVVLERRYRPDTVVEIRDEVAWLRGASIANGSPVDFLVAPPEASEARRVAFSQQAELVARLDHRGCPRFLEFGSRPDGTLFVVQSPVPIRNARSLFATPMDVEPALELALQLLDIVAHIHEQGVVHGNLSPEAVRVGGNVGRRELHVVDFSEAALIGQSDADPALDVYGVGLILYHLLAGRGPFADRSGPEPAPLPRSVPDRLRSVVAKMVAADPRLRFVGATDAAHALRNWTDEGAHGGVAKSRLTDNGMVSEDSSPTEQPDPPRLSAAVSDLVEELGSGSREAAAAPLLQLQQPEAESEPESPASVPELERSEPTETVADAPSDGPTGEVIEPAAASRGARRRSLTWIYVAVVLLGVSAVVFAVVRRPGSDAGADPELAPNADAEDRDGVVAGQPLADAARRVDGPTAPTTKTAATGAIDPMEALARVNDTDLDGAPSYEERQRYLERVRATPSTAALVDEELNATLDLVQASHAPAPCSTFDAGLARLEQQMSATSRERLCSASVEVPTPADDEDPSACAGMDARLAALCAEDSTVPRSARRRPNARRKSAPHKPPPSAAVAPPPSRPAKKSKASSTNMDKLDDELRPFDGDGA